MPPALFLDRDGVLNRDDGYTHVFNKSDIISESIDLIRYANELGYKVIIITNQSGIGRGIYSETAFHKFMLEMLEYYDAHEARINDYLYAPYHEKSKHPKYRRNKNDRKPNPGMIFRAKEIYDLDLHSSILVGDKVSDIEAGLAAKIQNLVLYEPNFSKLDKDYPAYIVESLRKITRLPIWKTSY